MDHPLLNEGLLFIKYSEPDEFGASWKELAVSSPSLHPWWDYLNCRPDTLAPSTRSFSPDTDPPPGQYEKIVQLSAPDRNKIKNVRETVRLNYVEYFRYATKRVLNSSSTVENCVQPMIYRFCEDAGCKTPAILEAIHTELFAPDRPDPRFIVLPNGLLEEEPLEGEYYFISSVDVVPSPSYCISLGKYRYPVVWTALRGSVRKVVFDLPVPDREEYGYVLDKTYHSSLAVSEYAEDYLLRNRRNPGEEEDLREAPVHPLPINRRVWHSPVPANDTAPARPHTIVRMSTRPTNGAHLYPVEPVANPELYLSLLRGIETTSQRIGRVVVYARVLNSEEKSRIKDRLGAFDGYGSDGDVELMESLLRLGSRFRDAQAPRADPRESYDHRSGESAVVRTLMPPKPDFVLHRDLLDCLYSKSGERGVIPRAAELVEITCVDGSTLALNAQQSRALALCGARDAPRLACVQSAPGSGKTTVTAAAAVVSSAPLLLLAMQNVAVDQIGTILSEFEHDQMVYNMKATARLDPFHVAPYDFFDHQSAEDIKSWRKWKTEVDDAFRRELPHAMKMAKRYWENLDKERIHFEKITKPTVLLSTVELALRKMLFVRPRILRKHESSVVEALKNVRRLIVDEASLLTEAVLHGLMRGFPEANFVLIGDKQQLPPFMYDSKILGQELAARYGLDIAMNSKRVPILTIVDVYRAPQSLVEPYNRVAYDRELVSRKTESATPLTEAGLILPGRPQLLFIEVDGCQELDSRSNSLYNEEEGKALLSLLEKFPRGYAERIMIICMYKEMELRVAHVLGPPYSVHTVNSSQGKEKRIVIVLTTRSKKKKDMGFFCCRRRCNVAISRQQEALIIIGHPSILKTCEPWATVVGEQDFTRVKADDL